LIGVDDAVGCRVLDKYRIGTPADTSASLRRKAADFLRMASETHDPGLGEEMRLLSTLYLERAAALEKAAATREAEGRA
jgi:hypothetical protein